jgi:hypothetical protein
MKRTFAAALATVLLLGATPAAKKTPSGFDLTADRVHFDLQGLAKSARSELRPAIPLPSEPEPGFGGEPANLRFHIGDEKIEDYVTSADRQIVIYPAPAWRALFVQAGEEKGNPVDRLRSLLAKGSSSVAGEIPILPPAEAVQILKARVKLLPFKGGKGFAFVAFYAQDNVPVANDYLFYTFQGLTDDGRYWVSFYYPVKASVLPKTSQDSPEMKDYEAFDKHYDAYVKKTVRALEDPKTAYTPDLGKLDALVRSIEIRK